MLRKVLKSIAGHIETRPSPLFIGGCGSPSNRFHGKIEAVSILIKMVQLFQADRTKRQFSNITSRREMKIVAR